ncbi:MAG: hypothetical protein LBC09_02865, partial [Helicobacteraceae bacterium]|nr:hypothetical protein [Helicobacteraceae bacterium]
GYKADRNVFVEIDSLNGKNIIAIAAGDRHSFAIAKDGRIYAAGDNEYGQLGLGDSGNKTNRKIFTEVKGLNAKNIIAIDAGSYHSLALAKDGKVYAAGHNYFAGLGEVTVRGVFTEITNLSDKNIAAIAAGGYHSLALSKDGRIYAAGYNKYGQLGLGGSGEEADRHTFTLVPIK